MFDREVLMAKRRLRKELALRVKQQKRDRELGGISYPKFKCNKDTGQIIEANETF